MILVSNFILINLTEPRWSPFLNIWPRHLRIILHLHFSEFFNIYRLNVIKVSFLFNFIYFSMWELSLSTIYRVLKLALRLLSWKAIRKKSIIKCICIRIDYIIHLRKHLLVFNLRFPFIWFSIFLLYLLLIIESWGWAHWLI